MMKWDLLLNQEDKRHIFHRCRDKSQGKDIFTFDLYESIRPDPVSYMKGKVYDKETGKLLKGRL